MGLNMNFTILFRGGSRYAVQKGQRTVGFNFLYLARETYPNVSDANISCKMTSRMDTDYLLTLTEDQARESGFLYTNKNGSQYEYF